MSQHVPKGGEDLGLQLDITKRMSNNWQASLGYSLSAGWDYQYPFGGPRRDASSR